MTKTDYTNAGQQRLLAVIRVLAGNEFDGLSLTSIAKSLNEKAPVVKRDLENLKTAGMGEQDERTGHWRLGPKFIQIAIAHFDHVNRTESRMAELKNRYSRG